MVSGLNFQILEVEGLYYPSSENKGADQLRGSLFSHMQKTGFLTTRLKLFKLSTISLDDPRTIVFQENFVFP